MSIFGDNIKRLRKNKGLKQQEIADILGVKRNTYSDWENGKTEPKLGNVVKLAHVFGTTTDELLGQTVYSKAILVRFLDDYDVSDIKNWNKEGRDSFKFAVLFEIISKNDIVGLFKLRDELVQKNQLDEEGKEILNTLFKEVYDYFNEN
jgi:transcriptional regulator with XRE-family HTH domain